MRKLFFFVLIGLSLLSCSRDNNSDEGDSSLIVPTKIRFFHNNSSREYTYFYNGTKLTEVRKDGYKIFTFEYSGDNITKITGYKNGDNIYLVNTYNYINNRLSKITSTEIANNGNQNSVVTDYTWTDDNTMKGKSIVTNSSLNVTFDYVYTFSNGNLTKSTTKTTWGSNDFSFIEQSWNYDSNNNPFKNVKGLKVLLEGEALNPFDGRANSSLTKESYKSWKQMGGTISNLIIGDSTYILEFNTNKFPFKGIINYNSNSNNASQENVEYTYNK
jgi:hypothetical protein